MPLNSADRAFLKTLYGRLKPDQPLPPGSPYYEPIFDGRPELHLEDPVREIATQIDFEGGESIRLFSGYRGSGKTTELKRLEQLLRNDGYFVLYADALDYLNPAEPIEIGELLVALAGAFGEALRKQLVQIVMRETYWERARRFLNTDVSVKDVGLRGEGGVAPFAKAALDLKFELRSPTSFKRQLQHMLAGRLKEVKDDADAFFEEGIKLIRKERGDDVKVVFIFDQLEQLRGTLQTEQTVIQSVERIFSIYADLLKIPYLHVVYTVPPYLKFMREAGALPRTILSTVHLWKNDPERSRYPAAWDAFRSLVHRRFDADWLRRLYGDDADAMVDRMIAVCGGHFRDLLRLLQRTVVRAASMDSLPVPPSVIDEAIAAARRDFLPVALDDAKWLAEIARVRDAALPSTEATAVNRLTRFLDNHSVLYFVNAEEWYDIHPLIREEVEIVLKASASIEA